MKGKEAVPPPCWGEAGLPRAHQSIQRHSMIPVALAQKQPPDRWESAFSDEHEEFFEDYSSSCPVWKSCRLRKKETACPIRVPGLGLQGWNLELSWTVYKNSTCLEKGSEEAKSCMLGKRSPSRDTQKDASELRKAGWIILWGETLCRSSRFPGHPLNDPAPLLPLSSQLSRVTYLLPFSCLLFA